MRWLVWAVIQYDCCPYKKGKFRLRDAGKEHVHRNMKRSQWWFHKLWSAKGCQQMTRSQERGMGHSPSQLRKNQPCGHLALGLQLAELWDDTFLLFKLTSLWYFVLAALGSECCLLPLCGLQAAWLILTFSTSTLLGVPKSFLEMCIFLHSCLES